MHPSGLTLRTRRSEHQVDLHVTHEIHEGADTLLAVTARVHHCKTEMHAVTALS